MASPLPDSVEQRIFFFRGKRVMLDRDLAKIYGTVTKRLLEQVRRNKDRFPQDFAFQLNNQEFTILRSQIATLSLGWQAQAPETAEPRRQIGFHVKDLSNRRASESVGI